MYALGCCVENGLKRGAKLQAGLQGSDNGDLVKSDDQR